MRSIVEPAAEMATFSQVDVENACEVVASSLGYSTLREHQIRVMSSFVRGNDVFGVLPTEYGKSLCYAVLATNGGHAVPCAIFSV